MRTFMMFSQELCRLNAIASCSRRVRNWVLEAREERVSAYFLFVPPFRLGH